MKVNPNRRLWHVLMQGGRCIVCGEPLFPGIVPPKWGGLSNEHKVPRIHKGSNERANLAASHHECNRFRADRVALHRLRPTQGSGQRQGNNWRSQLLTTSPGGVWWTQRKIELQPEAKSDAAR